MPLYPETGTATKKGQGNVENVSRIYVKKGNEAREKKIGERKQKKEKGVRLIVLF